MLIIVVILLLSVSFRVSAVSYHVDIKDWNAGQIERIDKSRLNFTFAVFGDNKNSNRIFEKLLEMVQEDNALFAVDTGDTVMRGEPAYYESFLKQIDNYSVPVLTVLGNHEISGDGREYYSEIFGPYYYSFEVGNAYFIVLDDANERYVDSQQMSWLERELERGQNYTYRFIFMHVPLYDPRKPMEGQPGHSLGNISNAGELARIFDLYNVTTVFCGHIHGYFNGTWGRTPYIITGGAGAEIIGGRDKEHYFYHYILVSVSPDGVSYRVVRLPVGESYTYRMAYAVAFHLFVVMKVNFLDILIFSSAIYLTWYAFSCVRRSRWRNKR